MHLLVARSELFYKCRDMNNIKGAGMYLQRCVCDDVVFCHRGRRVHKCKGSQISKYFYMA